jgi:hypothetical protein
MDLSVTLFHLESSDITVDIKAFFENEDLVVEGYDIGKRVEEYFGDSDYEYSVRIQAGEVPRLAQLLGVALDKELVLTAIAAKFNDNHCYSNFRNFLEANKIPSEGFSY